MTLNETINSLQRSIQIIADPKNDPADKLDEVESALRDIAAALEELRRVFAMLAR